MPEISKYAVIEKGAKLADDVRVGPFTYIGSHVRIGAGCTIGPNVTITGHTTLGQRNKVFPMAVIGTSESDQDEAAQTAIGDANVIREHVTIYGGLRQPTRIGTDNLIMIGCQIGGACQIGNHGIFVNNTQIGAGARIEDYVRTSGFVVIDPGRTVGAYTFTLGYAQIDSDAPPFAMVQGPPLRVRSVNDQNLRRCGFGDDDIRALKAAFRELYNGQGQLEQADVLRRLLAGESNPHIRRLVEAIQSSQDGGVKA